MRPLMPVQDRAEAMLSLPPADVNAGKALVRASRPTSLEATADAGDGDGGHIFLRVRIVYA